MKLEGGVNVRPQVELVREVSRGFPLVQHKYHQALISYCGINVVNVARW